MTDSTDTIDPSIDLSQFTTAQLSYMRISLEEELIAYMSGEGPEQNAARDRMGMAAVALLDRIGPEIVRRHDMVTGPRSVHYETNPDGSDPVRFTSTLCF